MKMKSADFNQRIPGPKSNTCLSNNGAVAGPTRTKSPHDMLHLCWCPHSFSKAEWKRIFPTVGTCRCHLHETSDKAYRLVDRLRRRLWRRPDDERRWWRRRRRALHRDRVVNHVGLLAVVNLKETTHIFATHFFSF